LLVTAFVLVLPFRDVQWGHAEAFIPIVDTLLFLIGLITAILLFSQVAITQSRSLLVLACGFLFTACIIVPHLLTFPGAFSEAGLFGGQIGTSEWLYGLWHLGVPGATLAYAFMRNGWNRSPIDAAAVRSTILVYAAATVVLVVTVTWAVIAAGPLLPDLLIDELRLNADVAQGLALLIVIVSAVAIYAVGRGRGSMIDTWLMVVIAGWVVEIILLATSDARFTVAWYVGRMIGLLASSLMLALLITESTKTYSRLAIAAAGRARDREGKRMTLEVLIESIAHELHQPLSAVIVNGDAALRLLEKDPADIAEVRAALEDISNEGHRAGQIIDSMRQVLAASHDPAPVSVPELVDESLLLLRTELEAHHVSLKLEADPNLPAVTGDRGRLLQVLVNLEMNALESMQAVTNRARQLRVRSMRNGASGVAISVEDSGTGILPEHMSRIFEPFFSTKPRGVGLGLAICRAIVDAHGGKISLTSGSAGGSAFRVVLPST
jgi:signal transduction histidine kinase